jgi:SAM-dependent methyltransferase
MQQTWDASPYAGNGRFVALLAGSLVEALRFDGEFDAVFSNAALHWMRDQDAVLQGVYRALKPGGRFMAECGGHGNIAAIRVALLAVLTAHAIPPESIENNRFFSDTEYRALLESNGFLVEQVYARAASYRPPLGHGRLAPDLP